MIRFNCHGCRQTFDVPESMAGTSAQCNQCGAIVQVPWVQPTAPQLPAPGHGQQVNPWPAPSAATPRPPAARVARPTPQPPAAPVVPAAPAAAAVQPVSMTGRRVNNSNGAAWATGGGGLGFLVVGIVLAMEITAESKVPVGSSPVQTTPASSGDMVVLNNNGATKGDNQSIPLVTDDKRSSSPLDGSSMSSSAGSNGGSGSSAGGAHSGSSSESPRRTQPVGPRSTSSDGAASDATDASKGSRGSKLKKSDIQWSATPDPGPTVTWKKSLAVSIPDQSRLHFPRRPSRFVAVSARWERGANRYVLFDLSTGKQVGKPIDVASNLPLDERYQSLTHDGRYFLSGVVGRNAVAAMSFETGEIERDFELVGLGTESMFCPVGDSGLLTVSSSGRTSQECTAKVWSLDAGQLLREKQLPFGVRASERGLFMSPGGRYSVHVGHDRLFVLDVESLEVVGEAPFAGQFECEGASFAADGVEFAVLGKAAFGDSSLFIWDFATGKVVTEKVVKKLEWQPFYQGERLEFAPDRKWLIHCGSTIIERSTGATLYTLKGGHEARHLASSEEILVPQRGKDGFVLRLEALPVGRFRGVLENVEAGATADDVGLPPLKKPDLASAKKRSWPTEPAPWRASPDPLKSPATPAASSSTASANDIQVSPSDEKVKRVILGGGRAVVLREPGFFSKKKDKDVLWLQSVNLANGSKVEALPLPKSSELLDASQSGEYTLVGIRSDREVERLDVLAPLKKATAEKHVAGWRPFAGADIKERAVHWVAFTVASTGEQRVLTYNQTGRLISWELPACKATYVCEDFGQPVAVSPGGRHFIAAKNSTLMLFDAGSCQLGGQLEISEPFESVPRAAFRPDGKEFVAILSNGQQQFLGRWELSTGKRLALCPLPFGVIQAFANEPNLGYRGSRHVLVDNSYLIDVENQAVVWKYVFDGQPALNSPDGRQWHAVIKPNSPNSPVFLRWATIPSAVTKTKTEFTKLEKQLVPGTQTFPPIERLIVGESRVLYQGEEFVKQESGERKSDSAGATSPPPPRAGSGPPPRVPFGPFGPRGRPLSDGMR